MIIYVLIPSPRELASFLVLLNLPILQEAAVKMKKNWRVMSGFRQPLTTIRHTIQEYTRLIYYT